MKNFIIALFGLSILGLLVSCETDRGAIPESGESLIEHIVNSSDVILLSPDDLPIQICNYIDEQHHPIQIEMAFHAHGLGYETMLENGMCIFFDNNGSHLNHDGIHNDRSNYHRGDYHCMMGDTLDVGAIPEIVQSLIADNYPGLTIDVVVIKPSGKLCVELSDDTVLMFSPDGDLITECQAFSNGTGNQNDLHGHNHDFGTSSGGHCDSTMIQGGGNPGHPMHPGNQGNMMGHGFGTGGIGPCWGGVSIPLADLPSIISNYLELNYRGLELLFVTQNYNDYYMLRLEDCVRLVFDENGVLLFDSGN